MISENVVSLLTQTWIAAIAYFQIIRQQMEFSFVPNQSENHYQLSFLRRVLDSNIYMYMYVINKIIFSDDYHTTIQITIKPILRNLVIVEHHADTPCIVVNNDVVNNYNHNRHRGSTVHFSTTVIRLLNSDPKPPDGC